LGSTRRYHSFLLSMAMYTFLLSQLLVKMFVNWMASKIPALHSEKILTDGFTNVSTSSKRDDYSAVSKFLSEKRLHQTQLSG